MGKGVWQSRTRWGKGRFGSGEEDGKVWAEDGGNELPKGQEEGAGAGP